VGGKVFQEFVHVLCHKFIELPSNRDLVNLAILGDGTLVLAISEGRATHNGVAIEPLPYADEWRHWVAGRLDELRIPRGDLAAAELTVDYRVELRRSEAGLRWLAAQFDFRCSGVVAASDRDYRAELAAVKEWGFSQV
jgi:hypothetical protein